MRFRAVGALVAFWLCLGRVDPASSAPPRDGTGSPSPTDSSESDLEVLEVWIRSEDPAWVARAEGQLSDLAVRMRVLSEPIEADPEQQLVAGKSVPSDGLVVWLWPDARATGPLSPQGEGSYVFVWAARAQRLYVRRVGPRLQSSDAAEWSATLEIAALVLRTAVRAALAGKSLGAQPQQLSFPASTGDQGADVPKTVRREPVRDPHWFGSVRASLVLDGQTEAGLPSIGPEFQVEVRRWRIGATVGFGFPSTLESEQARLVLRRHVLAAVLGRPSEVSPGLDLIPELWAGLAAFHRKTQAGSVQLQATRSTTTTSGLFGLACTLKWAVYSPAFLGLGLGVAWVPGAPTLQLLRSDRTVLASHALWQLEPQGDLQLGMYW